MTNVPLLKRFVLLRSSDGGEIMVSDVDDEAFAFVVKAGSYFLKTAGLSRLFVSPNVVWQQTDFDFTNMTVLDSMPVTVTNFDDLELEVAE
jgi:hypothetical protein